MDRCSFVRACVYLDLTLISTLPLHCPAQADPPPLPADHRRPRQPDRHHSRRNAGGDDSSSAFQDELLRFESLKAELSSSDSKVPSVKAYNEHLAKLAACHLREVKPLWDVMQDMVNNSRFPTSASYNSIIKALPYRG